MNQNKILLTPKLIQQIKSMGEHQVIWSSYNSNEGWRVERVPNAYVAHNIVFESEDAKVMFLLKYGGK